MFTSLQVLGDRQVSWVWRLFPPIFIAPAWGIASVKLFLAGILSIAGALIDVVGTIRGKGDRGRSPIVFAAAALNIAMSWGSLYGMDFLFRSVLELDHSTTVRVIYWAFVVLGALHSALIEIPDTLKQQWRIAHVEGDAVDAFLDEVKSRRRLGLRRDRNDIQS